MTLYREAPGPFPVWDGEPIGGITHPRNIEQLWLAADLVAIGLWRDDMIAPADPVPEGKVITATTVERVGEVVQFVHALADLPNPSVEDVITERERRLAGGFDYDFGDERGVHHIGTTPEDMRKWMDEVTPISQALINAGQAEAIIGVSTDTGPVEVEAMEWQLILIAAGQWRQPIYQRSFEIQAMSPIPHDFADDAYWVLA